MIQQTKKHVIKSS